MVSDRIQCPDSPVRRLAHKKEDESQRLDRRYLSAHWQRVSIMKVVLAVSLGFLSRAAARTITVCDHSSVLLGLRVDRDCPIGLQRMPFHHLVHISHTEYMLPVC